jgi:hypothetical protein
MENKDNMGAWTIWGAGAIGARIDVGGRSENGVPPRLQRNLERGIVYEVTITPSLAARHSTFRGSACARSRERAVATSAKVQNGISLRC